VSFVTRKIPGSASNRQLIHIS